MNLSQCQPIVSLSSLSSAPLRDSVDRLSRAAYSLEHTMSSYLYFQSSGILFVSLRTDSDLEAFSHYLTSVASQHRPYGPPLYQWLETTVPLVLSCSTVETENK